MEKGKTPRSNAVQLPELARISRESGIGPQNGGRLKIKENEKHNKSRG